MGGRRECFFCFFVFLTLITYLVITFLPSFELTKLFAQTKAGQSCCKPGILATTTTNCPINHQSVPKYKSETLAYGWSVERGRLGRPSESETHSVCGAMRPLVGEKGAKLQKIPVGHWDAAAAAAIPVQ